ncbi:MAG: hypothetical protein GY953_54905, partial [bacterium]|nr:hypothetical protein [bacterium]
MGAFTSRRDWLLGAGVAAGFAAGRGVAAESPVLLSAQGCGRASGYAESNKIVTSGDRTHVAWLDSPPEGFRVRVRTLNRRTGDWSPTVTVGAAHDNHGGPALTIDSQGYLHIVYYPHHHAIRYRKSRRPNDASEWGDEVLIGGRLTYPTLVCGRDDTLYLTCRRSFEDRPWEVELWKRPPGEPWRRQGAILASRHKGYAHFQESLAWGEDHRTLHLCCRFHEKSDREAYGRLQTVAYLASRDFGRSWQRSDGRNVPLPATAETADSLATGGVDYQRTLRAGAMAVDPEGRPHLLYSVEEKGEGKLFAATPDGGGRWRRIDLSRFVPDELSNWRLTTPGGLTFDGRGEMIAAAMVWKPEAGESGWGHPSSEVVRFSSS